jgi:type VI secretion system VasI/ImpG family protein
MDDLTLRYYDAEMRYLLEAGEEFARAHPEQAAMLNLDKAGARDPYVERLFEGFAFLMGRLREKLDDDLPELTEGLVSLLWPHYLRTIPSMSVVEFTPDWREMKEQMRIVKGFEVNSRPIGEKGTRCRYTTTKEMTLQPLSLEHARLSTDPDGRSVISLRFNCSHLADWSRVDLSQIPFYFNADAPLACAMHEAFTMNTAVPGCGCRVTWTEDRWTGISPRWGLAMMTGCGRREQQFQRLSAAAGVFHLPREIHVHRPAWAGDVVFPAELPGLKSTWCWQNAGSMTSALPKSICA